MAEEKSFAPSEKKLRKAREDGKVLKSSVVTQVAVMFGVIIGISASVWLRLEQFQELMSFSLTQGFTSPTQCLKLFIMEFGVIVTVSLGCGAAAGVAAELCQVGFSPEVGLLAPKSERLDPVAGAMRLFSGFKDLGIVLAKAVILAIASYFAVVPLVDQAPFMITHTSSLAWGGQMLIKVSWQVAGALICIAALDYFVVRRRFYKEMSMSHQEVREEYKEDDGDPHLKHARKAMHHELLFQDMVARVKRAKVIVVKTR
jgi:flagellar biosynthesis protein FlhB